MTHRPRRIAITAAAILVWTLIVGTAVLAEGWWFAQPRVTRGDPASLERHLVERLRRAVAGRRLGCAALVLVQDGRVVAEHGFGAASPDRTRFLSASVSKAVTAWGVMRLVEEGKLGLDEPVMPRLTRWRFPGSEAYRDRVTVRHLLSHTAGLDDGLGYSGFPIGDRPQTLEESLTSTLDSTVGAPRPVRVAWEPGSAMAYSGGGYTVLQLLVEEITSLPFSDYMSRAVLMPLGMTTASFHLDSTVAPAFDGDLQPRPHRRHAALAAVSLYATARDLSRFVLAFTGPNPVLRDDTLQRMMEPQPGTGGSWGLGQTLFARNATGGYVVGHDGGSPPAWGAMVRVNPASGNGMVLLVSGGRGAVNRLGHDWLYWETGLVGFEARRQVVQDRIVPAFFAVLLGAFVIVLRRHARRTA